MLGVRARCRLVDLARLPLTGPGLVDHFGACGHFSPGAFYEGTLLLGPIQIIRTARQGTRRLKAESEICGTWNPSPASAPRLVRSATIALPAIKSGHRGFQFRPLGSETGQHPGRLKERSANRKGATRSRHQRPFRSYLAKPSLPPSAFAERQFATPLRFTEQISEHAPE